MSLVKFVNIWYDCFAWYCNGFTRGGWGGLVNFSFVSGFIIGLLLGITLTGYLCLHVLETMGRRR